MLLNIIAHFTFFLVLRFYFYFLEEFLKKCWKILETIFPNAWKVDKERQDQGQRHPHYLNVNYSLKCFFLKDSILNRPTISNVVSNYQSVSVEVSSLPQSDSSSSSPTSTRSKSVKRVTSRMLLMKAKEVKLSKGFIKSTDHRPTIDYLLTDPPTHRPNNHRPTDKITFKRLGNMKTFILQNINTAGKMESYTSTYYLFE